MTPDETNSLIYYGLWFLKRLRPVHAPTRRSLASCSHGMFSTIISQTSPPLPCSIAFAV